MSIRIDSISVKGLGPISSIDLPLKTINLIFGKNEHGKTYLVEYLLRSLFKNSPKTRELTDSGQVIVRGFDGEKKKFFPKSPEKIETYLFPQNAILFDLSRLCVIKEGRSGFEANNYSTVSKSNLKEYLSDQSVFTKITEGIKSVVSKDTKIEDGKIVTLRRAGVLKKWHEASDEIRSLNDLFEEINNEYSVGIVNSIRRELEMKQEEINKQRIAKCAMANELSLQIEVLTSETRNITDDYIDQAKSRINNLQTINERIQRADKRLAEIRPKVVNFAWLSAAIGECEKHPDVVLSKISPIFFILSIIFLLGTVIVSFFQPYVSIGLGILTLVFLTLNLVQFQRRSKNLGESVEIERVLKEFQEKFGEKALSVATLKAKLTEISPLATEISVLTIQKGEEERDLIAQLAQLQSYLNKLDIQGADFETQMKELERKVWERDQKITQLNQLNMSLAKLDIPPIDYFQGESEVKYDSNQVANLNQKISELESAIKQEETKVEGLKRRVCDRTHDDFIAPWDVLIEHLRERCNEALQEQKDLCLQIVSGIIVSDAIEELSKKEDENISLALKSPQILGPIQAITPNYQGIDLLGEELNVFNDSQQLNLSDLSTGAKDQLLFALRVGLAEYLLQGEKLFFILDDAFQHSDWERRVILVNELGNLAKSGWQIVYFTMDNHIRDLFNSKIKPIFGDEYLYKEL